MSKTTLSTENNKKSSKDKEVEDHDDDDDDDDDDDSDDSSSDDDSDTLSDILGHSGTHHSANKTTNYGSDRAGSGSAMSGKKKQPSATSTPVKESPQFPDADDLSDTSDDDSTSSDEFDEEDDFDDDEDLDDEEIYPVNGDDDDFVAEVVHAGERQNAGHQNKGEKEKKKNGRPVTPISGSEWTNKLKEMESSVRSSENRYPDDSDEDDLDVEYAAATTAASHASIKHTRGGGSGNAKVKSGNTESVKNGGGKPNTSGRRVLGNAKKTTARPSTAPSKRAGESSTNKGSSNGSSNGRSPAQSHRSSNGSSLGSSKRPASASSSRTSKPTGSKTKKSRGFASLSDATQQVMKRNAMARKRAFGTGTGGVMTDERERALMNQIQALKKENLELAKDKKVLELDLYQLRKASDKKDRLKAKSSTFYDPEDLAKQVNDLKLKLMEADKENKLLKTQVNRFKSKAEKAGSSSGGMGGTGSSMGGFAGGNTSMDITAEIMESPKRSGAVGSTNSVALRATIKRLERELVVKDQEIKDMQKDPRMTRAAEMEAHLLVYYNEIRRLHGIIKNVEDANPPTDGERKNFKRKLKESKEKQDALRHTVVNLESKLGVLETENKQLRQETTDANHDRERATQKAKDLDRILGARTKEVDKLKARLKAVKNSKGADEDLKKENEQLQVKLRELYDRKSELETQRNAAVKRQKIESEIANKKIEEMRTMERQMDVLSKRAAAAEEMLEPELRKQRKANGKLDELESETGHLVRENELLKRKRDSNMVMIKQLNDDVSKWKSKYEKMVAKLQQTKAKLIASEQDREQLEKYIPDEEKSDSNVNHGDSYKKVQIELRTAKRKIATLERDLKRARKAVVAQSSMNASTDLSSETLAAKSAVEQAKQGGKKTGKTGKKGKTGKTSKTSKTSKTGKTSKSGKTGSKSGKTGKSGNKTGTAAKSIGGTLGGTSNQSNEPDDSELESEVYHVPGSDTETETDNGSDSEFDGGNKKPPLNSARSEGDLAVKTEIVAAKRTLNARSRNEPVRRTVVPDSDDDAEVADEDDEELNALAFEPEYRLPEKDGSEFARQFYEDQQSDSDDEEDVEENEVLFELYDEMREPFSRKKDVFEALAAMKAAARFKLGLGAKKKTVAGVNVTTRTPDANELMAMELGEELAAELMGPPEGMEAADSMMMEESDDDSDSDVDMGPDEDFLDEDMDELGDELSKRYLEEAKQNIKERPIKGVHQEAELLEGEAPYLPGEEFAKEDMDELMGEVIPESTKEAKLREKKKKRESGPSTAQIIATHRTKRTARESKRSKQSARTPKSSSGGGGSGGGGGGGSHKPSQPGTKKPKYKTRPPAVKPIDTSALNKQSSEKQQDGEQSVSARSALKQPGTPKSSRSVTFEDGDSAAGLPGTPRSSKEWDTDSEGGTPRRIVDDDDEESLSNRSKRPAIVPKFPGGAGTPFALPERNWRQPVKRRKINATIQVFGGEGNVQVNRIPPSDVIKPEPMAMSRQRVDKSDSMHSSKGKSTKKSTGKSTTKSTRSKTGKSTTKVKSTKTGKKTTAKGSGSGISGVTGSNGTTSSTKSSIRIPTGAKKSSSSAKTGTGTAKRKSGSKGKPTGGDLSLTGGNPFSTK
eukprot:TRINITY_DN2817_c0_g1_i5.p1 TRINITY_DN2817_c0_g1~~TRINITY_DN2817_c0_g1_i5.p1  ORF type:complete len:1782 (+),score=709.80 TRINITY_DN2817_c0_g1_i5:492-5348(+)